MPRQSSTFPTLRVPSDLVRRVEREVRPADDRGWK